MQLQSDDATIILLGKLGHGKTHLLNKLCGESFKSARCAESYTRQNQRETTLRYGITIIDTPGFDSSDDTDLHIRERRSAIDGADLWNIHHFLKYSFSSDMAENVNHLMDFAAVDDACIIVTHVDTCPDLSSGFDTGIIIEDLSSLLDVRAKRILLSRKGNTLG
jgi:predicted GTPase